MAIVNLRRMATVSCLLPSFALVAAAETSLPSLESKELAQGAYATMHMLLQKTFLRINVATIEVRVDKPTQTQLSELAAGKAFSDSLAPQLTQAVIGAQRAVVQMKFKRDVSLDRWMGVVRENLEQTRKAGLIDAGLEKRVSQELPQSFAALKSRGYEKDDRLIYDIASGRLRTVVLSGSGQVLVDRLDQDPGVRRVVLCSYFAPGSDFRDPLLRSLFENNR
jgi:hypothetical protein